MKIRNMTSNLGNDVPNQFIIDDRGTTYFQSYSTIIAKERKGKITLDKDRWNFSVTTGKYRNQFLGEDIAETRNKIVNGEYKLANLNKK